jgi:type IV secretory pathway TrbD component
LVEKFKLKSRAVFLSLIKAKPVSKRRETEINTLKTLQGIYLMSTKISMKGKMYKMAALSIPLLAVLIMPATAYAFQSIMDDVNAVTTNVGTKKITSCGACHVASGGGGARIAGIDTAYKTGINTLATLLRPKPPVVPPVVTPKPPVAPPVTGSCDLPMKLIKGICTVTPVSCNDAAKEYTREHINDRENESDRDDDKNKTKAKLATGLILSNPGTQTIRVGQSLRLGILASGDKRKIAVGTNLPTGARFTASYNKILQAQQGVMVWAVPNALANKTVKVKFCAKVHNGKGHGTNQNAQFAVRDVLVKVLPRLK